ncbi:hypothetical protein TEA_008891 [Camellia sinensis var. sinensis]|uniref:RRM domain-containing protein n=1 Tax=Camellia sinensis var. sinensis TaxID=542762 RepID=A0A4V3WJR9_CAMSN|nr:hypothetical protein TEA_008891 [Camellia sinensis var. sinensis]
MAYQHYRSPFGDTTFTKVFVGGLAWETPTDVMRSYFEQFGGEILEAVIIADKNTGKSKGYGFVTFGDAESARRACADPNPVIDGRRANCNIASLGRPRPSTPRGRNQGGSNPYHGGAVAQGTSPSSSYRAPPPAPLPPPPPPPVMYPPYGVCITHNFSKHNITINFMEGHHQLWALHTSMDIPCKLQGDHFLRPRHNVSKDHLTFTILRRWRGPSLPIHPPLLFYPCNHNHHQQQ